MAVQMRTMLAVADNSGARKLQVILPLGGGLGAKAGLGDVVTAAVKEASPDGLAARSVLMARHTGEARGEHDLLVVADGFLVVERDRIGLGVPDARFQRGSITPLGVGL